MPDVQPLARPDDPVAAALAQVVGDFGPSVIYSPGRLRASLSDVLGPIGRQCRAEVDAVTVAAEEGVATAISTGETVSSELAGAVAGRGIAPEMAAYAVAAWRQALTGTADPQRTVRRSASPGRAGQAVAAVASAAPPPMESVAAAATDAGPHSAVDGDRPPTLTASVTPSTVVSSATRQQAAADQGPGQAVTPLPAASAGASPALGDRPSAWRSSGAWALVSVLLPIAVAIGWLVVHKDGDAGAKPSARQTEQGSLSTLPVNSATLAARRTVWDSSVPYAWEGSGCTRNESPPGGESAAPCTFVLRVGVNGSVSDWRLTRVELSGPGSVSIRSRDQIAYSNPSNGPYTASVSYWVEGGGYQSTNRWELDMKCNLAFPCNRQ